MHSCRAGTLFLIDVKNREKTSQGYAPEPREQSLDGLQCASLVTTVSRLALTRSLWRIKIPNGMPA